MKHIGCGKHIAGHIQFFFDQKQTTALIEKQKKDERSSS